jgi:hypothetical protein
MGARRLRDFYRVALWDEDGNNPGVWENIEWGPGERPWRGERQEEDRDDNPRPKKTPKREDTDK